MGNSDLVGVSLKAVSVSVYYIQPRIPLEHYRVGTEEGPESSTVWVSPALFGKTVKGL